MRLNHAHGDFNGSGSFTIQASTANGDAGLGGRQWSRTLVNAERRPC
jgi:hypothetical protein